MEESMLKACQSKRDGKRTSEQVAKGAVTSQPSLIAVGRREEFGKMLKYWLRGLMPCTYTERVQVFFGRRFSPRLSPEPGSADGHAGSHASVLVLQEDGDGARARHSHGARDHVHAHRVGRGRLVGVLGPNSYRPGQVARAA